MRIDVHHHFHNELRIFDMNAALSTELSALQSVISTKDDTIASMSTVIAGGDASVSAAISSAVSAAVDADETDIAGSISTILG